MEQQPEPSMRLPSKGVSMRETPVEDPVFKYEPGPSTDVVARCPNGRVRGRSSAPIYVLFRVQLDGPDTDADVIGHSFDDIVGHTTIERMAAREAFGRDWNYQKDGSPAFDPIRDDGTTRPPPPGRFIMWDDIQPDIDGIPSDCRGCVTVYDAYHPETPDTRKAISRYKLMVSQPTLEDFMLMETAGDLKFLQ